MTALTSEELRELLKRLDGEPADALESNHLEFKSGNARGAQIRNQSRTIRESVVAFANADGGNLVLGVADGKRTRSAAIVGVQRIDINDLQRDIYDGTDPHITVDVEEVIEPEGRILIVRVPNSNQVHTTTDGMNRIRVGKESKPLTGSGLAQLFETRSGTDHTAQLARGENLDAIDPAEIRRLREMIRAEDTNPGLNGLSDEELLKALGLAEGERVNIAAILMLGHKSVLARYVSQHELTIARFREPLQYDFRRDIREPLLKTIDEVRRIIEANVRITTVQTAGFHHFEIPDISWIVIRESVLNALIHRDYFINGSIQVFLHHDRVEVTSPGGFVGDISPENVLRHAPVRRNHLLADAFRAIGLVERVGLGVDRIFSETLRAGKDFPRYESDVGTVKLTLPTAIHDGFARFVAERLLDGEELGLDDLMVLRSLMTRDELNRWSASEVLKVTETVAADRLAHLNSRGFLEVRGRGRGASYRLGQQFSDWHDVRSVIDLETLGSDEIRRAIVQAISRRGSVTNAAVRTITGFSRNETVRFMRSMREDGLIEVRGRGRGAHYVLTEQLSDSQLAQTSPNNRSQFPPSIFTTSSSE